MNIVIAASEVVPFAKTGGLADVAGALPKELNKLKHEVIVIMPRYKVIDIDKNKLQFVVDLNVEISNKIQTAKIYLGKLPGSKVKIYFIDCKAYFDRENLYQDDEGVDYIDNAARFAFFSRAILDLCKVINFIPDVINCNDWQTGLVPVYLKTLYAQDPFYSSTSTVFTIHNLAYQGLFDANEGISITQLPEEVVAFDKLEFWGQFSFIKGGLVYSDILNTVSEKYSMEIQTEEYGCGLEGLLSARRNDLFGIVNGLDYTVWDPAKDKKITQMYTIESIEDKNENKKELLRQYGLKYKKNVPLIGVISRLADQKGFDLISEIIDELMHEKVQFVLLGTGDKKYHDLFSEIAEKYPDKAGVALKYDGAMAQLIYAGCDMFLMPSKYEPCGLGQLISLKYGTIPIVRETGGLADTIVDYDMVDVFEMDKTNGFVFDKYSSKLLLDKITRAIKVYSDKSVWHMLQKNAMACDYSWKQSAKRYLDLYNIAISK
jgi:starch synthase